MFTYQNDVHIKQDEHPLFARLIRYTFIKPKEVYDLVTKRSWVYSRAYIPLKKFAMYT